MLYIVSEVSALNFEYILFDQNQSFIHKYIVVILWTQNDVKMALFGVWLKLC